LYRPVTFRPQSTETAIYLYIHNSHGFANVLESETRKGVGQRITSTFSSIIDKYPFSIKSAVNFLLLCLMGVCLSSLPRPYNVATFTVGITIISGDYKLFQKLGLDRLYQAITVPNITSRAENQYKRKQFAEHGPNRIELTPEGGGNFRARVSEGTEQVYSGLDLLLYVEAPIVEQGVEGDVDTYDLRLGTVEVTGVSEISGNTDGVTIFLSVSQWKSEFEDQRQGQLAGDVHAQFGSGDNAKTSPTGERSDKTPFAKVNPKARINDFSLSQWRAISRWINDEFGA
jgi:hypothetical protein